MSGWLPYAWSLTHIHTHTHVGIVSYKGRGKTNFSQWEGAGKKSVFTMKYSTRHSLFVKGLAHIFYTGEGDVVTVPVILLVVIEY